MNKAYALALHSVEPDGQHVRTEFIPVAQLGRQFKQLDTVETVREFDLWLRQEKILQNPAQAVQLVSFVEDAPETLMPLTPVLYLNAARIDAEDKMRGAPVHHMPPILSFGEGPAEKILIKTHDGHYFEHYDTDLVVHHDALNYAPLPSFPSFSKRLEDCKKNDRYEEKRGNFVQQTIEFVGARVSSLFKNAPRLG